MAHHENNPKEIILRDYLALDRTKLANQRTLLSFIRTSLYLVVSGIAVMEVQMLENLKFMGFILVGISLTILGLGIANYLIYRKKINKSYTGH